MPRVGKLGEPVAQLTWFGWLLMSPRIEAEINKLMCSKTSINDYENLCRLDVLSVGDIARNDIVGSKFLGSIQEKQGWLIRNWTDVEKQFFFITEQVVQFWKIKEFTANFTKNQELMEIYAQVFQEQPTGGLAEKVNDETSYAQREFYLPHKAVISKMLKVNSYELYMIDPKGKTAKFYH